ncbi:MAG: cytochrome c-type biogenesis protein CcmH [Rubrivivax sp.]|nr:cytochrome c-type biogenesis protein CcmH [Rubrivivax sp.]
MGAVVRAVVRALLWRGLPRVFFVAFVVAAATGAWAAPAADIRTDAAIEARVQVLAAELRCLVCQNQSLADSNADLAVDLKNQVREQLRAGRSGAEVMAFMTERYGDFVRYRPPLKSSTVLLWAGPALMVLLGGTLLWRGLRRACTAAGGSPQGLPREGAPPHEALSTAQRSQAAALLDAAPPADA